MLLHKNYLMKLSNNYSTLNKLNETHMKKIAGLVAILALTIASCNNGSTSTTTTDSTKVDSTKVTKDTVTAKADTVAVK